MPRPSLAQHRGEFRGPYLSDFMVNTVNELGSDEFIQSYAYKHKIVWVMETECWYYLFDDAAAGTAAWKQISTPGRILEWSRAKTYTVGETVYYNSLDPHYSEDHPGKGIFVALEGTTPGKNPLEDPDHWLCISDDTRFITVELTNATSFSYPDASPNREIMAKFFELNAETGYYEEVHPSVSYKKNENGKLSYLFEFFSGCEYTEDKSYPDDVTVPQPHAFTGLVKIFA